MDKIRDLVSEELNLLEQELVKIKKNHNTMFDDLSNFVQGKSKRVRSLLCFLYLKSNNIDITSEIISLLAATELIHNASLLHDDVTDDSHTRRGVQNLFDKYGSKLSVISGDYLLSLAVEILFNLKNQYILNLFLSAVKKMSEAEIKQFFSRNTNVSVEKYLCIVKGKTAPLFSACMEAAANLSGINSDVAKTFGFNFGILFQINNDMDTFSAENDKNNGIKTAVDILGIEKTLALKDNYKEELSKILISIPDNKYKTGIEDLIKLL